MGSEEATLEEEDSYLKGDDEKLSAYERLRQQRIQQNSAKLMSLNLPCFPTALHSCSKPSTSLPPARRSSRIKSRLPLPTPPPPLSDNDDEDNDSTSTRDSEYQNTDGDSSASEPDNACEDEELAMALALSLGKDAETLNKYTIKSAIDHKKQKKQVSIAEDQNCKHDKSRRIIASPDSDRRRKRQKKGCKEILMFAESELSKLFHEFDETGKGMFSAKELEQNAVRHDFSWSKQEIFDMIDIFDKDRDGQLNLSEFREMAIRCNLMKLPI